MARLFVLSGNSIGETHDIDATSTLGRGDDVDVTIPDASISRRHARLVPQPEAGVWGIVDLKSANGVFIDGRRVVKGKVRNGETFRLGEVEIRLKDESVEEVPSGGTDDLDWVDEEPGEEPGEKPTERPGEFESAEGAEPGELELEFDGDLDEALSARPVVSPKPATDSEPARAPRRSTPAASRSEKDRAGAIASQERAARRSQAMGGAARGPSAVVDGGRPILQYAKVRSGGTDLAQLPGWQKLVIAVLAVGLLGAAAYGAFALTTAAKGAQATDAP